MLNKIFATQLTLLIVLCPVSIYGQQIQDCDSLFREIKGDFSKGIGYVVYDECPSVLNKEKLCVIDKDIKHRATVLIELIVDEAGKLQCARVLKSENKKLNKSAIEQLKLLCFISAKQRGVPVRAILILPIVFDKS